MFPSVFSVRQAITACHHFQKPYPKTVFTKYFAYAAIKHGKISREQWHQTTGPFLDKIQRLFSTHISSNVKCFFTCPNKK